MKPVKVLVPSGVLGLGFDPKALKAGIRGRPDIISIDGGSTDSGPASLGSDTSKYSRAAIKAEWKVLMMAREEAQDSSCYWKLWNLWNQFYGRLGWKILQLN